MHNRICGWDNVTVDVTKMVPTEDGLGNVSRLVAKRTGNVVLEIDARSLDRYVRQAMKNGNGRCVLAGGAIRFVAKDVQEERFS